MTAMPGSPEPVGQDPSRPLIGNIGRQPGQQPTFPYADLNNPNLTQFAKDGLRKVNQAADAGFAMYSRESRCWHTGVPVYLQNPAQPTFFLQTPKQVTMIWQMDQQVRHVYLNVPHSKNPKPSWYGESVGHYDGEWLVVDTIGQNTQSFLDNFRTPHSDKLHVIERYRLVDYDTAKDAIDRNAKENSYAPGAWDYDRAYRGKVLQLHFTVEDEGVFTTPWTATITYRPAVDPWTELICAENPREFNNTQSEVPAAKKPDF